MWVLFLSRQTRGSVKHLRFKSLHFKPVSGQKRWHIHKYLALEGSFVVIFYPLWRFGAFLFRKSPSEWPLAHILPNPSFKQCLCHQTPPWSLGWSSAVAMSWLPDSFPFTLDPAESYYISTEGCLLLRSVVQSLTKVKLNVGLNL